MPKIRKFVIGIKPFRRMFRVRNRAGEIADELIELLDEKSSSEIFTQVRRNSGDELLVLQNEDQSISLSLNTDTVMFTRNFYENKKHCDFDKEVKQFNELFVTVNSVLEMTGVRRIGIYAEYRFAPKGKNPSDDLLKNLTKLDRPGYLAKFNLQFESRTKLKGDGLINEKEDAFLNVIESYYDSKLDADQPKDDFLNANIDVQKYYAPLLDERDVVGEVLTLKREFEKQSDAFTGRLKNMGFNDGAW